MADLKISDDYSSNPFTWNGTEVLPGIKAGANGAGLVSGLATYIGTALGAVAGPGSAVSGHLAVFSGTSGKLLADGGAAPTGTNTGDQTITLTGDVGGSGAGTFAATIANDAVTYAKLQNVSATARVLGRKTASAGDAEECTLSDVLDMVGSAAQGDILYRGASTWARLAAGTSGQMLKTQGASANPHWVDHEFLPVVSLSAVTTASQVLLKFTAPFGMTLAANMSGSKSTAADVAATASTVITINKNGSAIATATYAAAGTVPTLATTGGTSQTIATDDVVSFVGPVAPDATLSGIYLVALFARS